MPPRQLLCRTEEARVRDEALAEEEARALDRKEKLSAMRARRESTRAARRADRDEKRSQSAMAKVRIVHYLTTIAPRKL